METTFKDKVALVTGASSGIGKACAIMYASLGAKTIVSDINETEGNKIVNKIKEDGGEAYWIKADVSDAAQCKNLVDKTIEKYGRLDMACNNAGVGGEANMVSDMTIEGWNSIIAINLSSVFYCMKYEIVAMMKNGGGAIVNMSSILGKVGFAASAGYAAAKHGLLGLTETAALEYSSKGIRINSVGPGFIETPLLTALDRETKAGLVQKHPIGRLGEASEVAELVIWLSSDKASFVTGSYYPVDGGYLAN